MKKYYSNSAKFVILTILSCSVTACASTQGMFSNTSDQSSKEYFAESKYGAKASPIAVSSSVTVKNHNGSYVKTGRPYKVNGKWYYPINNLKSFTQVGKASWYGPAFNGRYTANGEIYNMNALSAAHPTMPLPSYARVTNLSNGSSVVVRVNDRGPYVNNRIIDLSKRAAEVLNYRDNGLANVKVEYIGPAPLVGDDSKYLMASYRSHNLQISDKFKTLLAKNEHTNVSKKSKSVEKLSAKTDTVLAYSQNLPENGPVLNFRD